MTDAEYVARRRAADIDRGTCLFPDSHPPAHPADFRFRVRLGADWEDLTEAEIAARASNGFLHSSQWDFWFEEVEPIQS